MKKATPLLAAIGTAAAVALAAPAHAAPFSTTFGPTFSFSDGIIATTSVTVAVPTVIVGDMTIDLSVIGDINNSGETLDFQLDGVSFGTLCNANTGDDPFSLSGFTGGDACIPTTLTGINDSFFSGVGTIAFASVAPLIADGLLEISIVQTADVDTITDITSPSSNSGVLFPVTSDFAVGFGGTVSFNTAIPEPGALALFGLGLAGIGFAARRKRKAA